MPPVLPLTSAFAAQHAREESSHLALSRDLFQLDSLLILHLERLRRRGRTPLGEAVAGAVIEDGEAEGLLYELANAHAPHDRPTHAGSPPPPLTLEEQTLANDWQVGCGVITGGGGPPPPHDQHAGLTTSGGGGGG